MSLKCLVLCKSYQLVGSTTINYYKRIMMEREKGYLNWQILDLYTVFTLLILKMRDDSPDVKPF